jgi:hypothetical protein
VAAAPLGRPARAAAAMAGESAESVPTDIEAARGAVAEPESGSRVGGIGGTVGGTLGGIVGGTAGSADGAAGPFGLGGASIAADGQAQPRTRTSSNPTRYSDETNGAGPRLRAPTVPTRAPTVPMSPPAEQPAAKAPAPTATPTNPLAIRPEPRPRAWSCRPRHNRSRDGTVAPGRKGGRFRKLCRTPPLVGGAR